MQHARISGKHLTTVPTAAAKLPPTSSAVSTGIWTTPRSAGNGRACGWGAAGGCPRDPWSLSQPLGQAGARRGRAEDSHRGQGQRGRWLRNPAGPWPWALSGPELLHDLCHSPGTRPRHGWERGSNRGGPAPGCPVPRSGRRAVGHGKAPHRGAERSWGQRGSAGAQQHTHVSCPPCLFYLYFSNLLIASFLTNQQ